MAALLDDESDDGLDALLQAQAAVMTVRGATRAEFVEVMGLSRL